MFTDRDAEVSYETTTFVAELRRLADALESGTSFMIEVDGEEVTIPEAAVASVAHEREDGQVELEFQLTWTEAGGAEEMDETAGEDTPEAGDAPIAELAHG